MAGTLLSLQSPAIAGDAVPSRPMLYPLRTPETHASRTPESPSDGALLRAASRLDWARAQDAADALAPLRARFACRAATTAGRWCISAATRSGWPRSRRASMIEAEIEDWERLGVLGHEQARTAWIGYAEQLQAPLAQLRRR